MNLQFATKQENWSIAGLRSRGHLQFEGIYLKKGDFRLDKWLPHRGKQGGARYVILKKRQQQVDSSG